MMIAIYVWWWLWWLRCWTILAPAIQAVWAIFCSKKKSINHVLRRSRNISCSISQVLKNGHYYIYSTVCRQSYHFVKFPTNVETESGGSILNWAQTQFYQLLNSSTFFGPIIRFVNLVNLCWSLSYFCITPLQREHCDKIKFQSTLVGNKPIWFNQMDVDYFLRLMMVMVMVIIIIFVTWRWRVW